MSDITTVETQIIGINEWTTVDEIAEMRDRLAAFAVKLKEMRQMLDEKMLEMIADSGEDIVIGPIRYYAGTEKTTKCIDNEKAMIALLTAAGGDVAALAGCIASDGLKPGASRSLLGDAFNQYFETTEKPKIKDGKPVKALLSANENFTKGAK